MRATWQPGKIPHELRRGELAELGLVPYRPYYGTADATPLYIILLHTAWRFTGDRGLIEQHLATAERCLVWIDEFGDMDGDGFQEYQCRTPKARRKPGLEGFRQRHSRRERRRRAGAESALRTARLRL